MKHRVEWIDPRYLKCPFCGGRIQRYLSRFAFVPMPIEYLCPYCQQKFQTSFSQRSFSLLVWTLQTYGIVLFFLILIGGYIQAGYWHQYGLRYFLGYLIWKGPYFLFGLILSLILTSIVIQWGFDLWFRWQKKSS